jgi:hypothetical protein
MSGSNFGLNDDYKYYEFELDSLDATSSFNGSDLATDWPFFEVAAKGPLRDVVAIKILEAQIPFSFYVFNSVNNTFILTEDSDPPVTVTIPEGNYTSGTLATALATALNAVHVGGGTYTVTYSSLTDKFTFSISGGGSSAFTFTFGAGTGIPGVQPNSGNRNPRLWIGFPPGVTRSTTSSPFKITSPNTVLITGPSYIYVNSAKLGSDVDVFLPAGAFNLGGGKAGPQMAKVPVNCNPGSTIYWQDPDPQKWFKFDQLQSLNGFDFYLTLGNTTSQLPLKLNGLGFSLKLGILMLQKTSVDSVIPTAQNGRVSRREGPKRPRPTF